MESVSESKGLSTYLFTARRSARTCFIFQNDSKGNIFRVFRALCKGVTGKAQAWTETRGSGKGEVKEMSTVCGGSWPRDGTIIKTTGPNYTVPHTEWTPLTVSLRCSSSPFYFLFVIGLTYTQLTPRYAPPHENLTQLEEKAKISAVVSDLGVKLFLGTQRWTCATIGRRFNNKS